MGGFSSQVQQAQTSQPSSGKGSIGNMAEPQVMPVQPNQTAQPMPEMTAQPAVMPQGGGGKGQRNYEQRPGSFRDETPYAPPDGTRGGKGSSTNSATSGQPRMGQPNRYTNTIPQWDNASQQLGSARSGGKGKGG
jgi:hypothetical protein